MNRKGFFSRLFGAMNELKVKESQEAAVKALTEDPLTIELIERIAKSYDYHFEVVRPDGTVLRFVKRVGPGSEQETGVW